MSGKQGGFILSLDFELNWGTWSEVSLDRNRKRLEETRRVIPRLLELFTEYNVHATWATVGFLFCGSRDELMDRRPVAPEQRLALSSSPAGRTTVLTLAGRVNSVEVHTVFWVFRPREVRFGPGHHADPQ